MLVIDDDKFTCGAIAAQLRSLGARKVETSFGDASTMKLLEDAPPFDLIVSDLAMPALDGLQLTQVLAARQSSAAVVYVSATGPTHLAEARTFGASRGLRVFGALAKPLRIEDWQQVLVRLATAPLPKPALSAIGKAMAVVAPGQRPLIGLIDGLSGLPHLRQSLMRVWAHTLGDEITPELVEAAEQLGTAACQSYLQIKAENERLIHLLWQVTGVEIKPAADGESCSPAAPGEIH